MMMTDIFNLSIEDDIVDNVACQTSYQAHKSDEEELLKGKETKQNADWIVEDQDS